MKVAVVEVVLEAPVMLVTVREIDEGAEQTAEDAGSRI